MDIFEHTSYLEMSSLFFLLVASCICYQFSIVLCLDAISSCEGRNCSSFFPSLMPMIFFYVKTCQISKFASSGSLLPAWMATFSWLTFDSCKSPFHLLFFSLVPFNKPQFEISLQKICSKTMPQIFWIPLITLFLFCFFPSVKQDGYIFIDFMPFSDVT